MAATWGGPSSSAGYWRGGMSDGPLWKNQGSGYGPNAQGIGMLPPGTGVPPSGKAWSPTVVYLLVFVVLEMVVFKCLERALR